MWQEEDKKRKTCDSELEQEVSLKYICMYSCMCIFTYLCVYVCMYLCGYVWLCALCPYSFQLFPQKGITTKDTPVTMSTPSTQNLVSNTIPC